MPKGFLDHNGLLIIKGIGKTAGDSNSAEADPVVINLMDGVFTLARDGWSPNIPATKNGGVWSDSPINDGRTLLAAPVGNVTESMTIQIVGDSYLGAMNSLASLNKMMADCRDFWQSEYQIDPVYLAWWAGCGVGYQYALLYNIELKPEYQDAPKPTIRVSMTLEREQYWRAIPPGANPKMWTYYVNSAHPQFNVNTASLITGSDHLITQTPNNKFEWTPAATGLQTTPITKNYIDITAAQVPGDAPALVEMAITTSLQQPNAIYVSRSSKKTSGKSHTGVTRYNSYILNAGDGNTASIATKTIGGAPDAVLSNNSSVNPYYGARTVTGVDANYVNLTGWGGATGANGIVLDRQFYRGTFAVFVRAINVSAAAPTLADMKIRVLFEEFEDNTLNQYLTSMVTNEANVPLNPANGSSLIYLGTVTLPFEDRAVQSVLGYGIQLQEGSNNLRITIQQQVLVATANRAIRVIDLILMPIDEAMATIQFVFNVTSPTGTAIMDNTGYMARGKPELRTLGYMTGTLSGGVSQQTLGQDITLLPRTDQRLYFIGSGATSSTENNSRVDESFNVRLNIVPRYSGIRTE